MGFQLWERITCDVCALVENVDLPETADVRRVLPVGWSESTSRVRIAEDNYRPWTARVLCGRCTAAVDSALAAAAASSTRR